MPNLSIIRTTTDMTTTMHNPPHPGEVLREWLDGVTVTDAADRLGVTRAALSRVINGAAGISRTWTCACPRPSVLRPAPGIRCRPRSTCGRQAGISALASGRFTPPLDRHRPTLAGIRAVASASVQGLLISRSKVRILDGPPSKQRSSPPWRGFFVSAGLDGPLPSADTAGQANGAAARSAAAHGARPRLQCRHLRKWRNW